MTDFAEIYMSHDDMPVVESENLWDRLTSTREGAGDWKEQRLIDYIIRFGWGHGRKQGYPDHTIEDGISEGLLRIIRGSRTYDPEIGGFETWCTTVVRNAIAEEARNSVTGIDRLTIVSIDETIEGADSDTPLREVVSTWVEPEYTFDVEHNKQVLEVQRSIAKRVLGTELYQIALQEIVGGTGWRSRVASRIGKTAAAVSWRLDKARKEYRGIGKRLDGIG